MIDSKLRILKVIGESPYMSKEEIANKLGLEKTTIGSIINKQRCRTRVVKAPPYDQEKGFKWFLTGKGYRYVKDRIEELRKELGLDIGELHLVQFKPRHKRNPW